MRTGISALIAAALLMVCTFLPARAESPAVNADEANSQPQVVPSAAPPEPSVPPALPPEKRKQTASEQLLQQEHQRILGIIPEFNSSNIANAQPLTPKQKFSLAFKSGTDPFQFAYAALDAGISQMGDDYAGYGQGVAGYAKRFGASYADTFDGAILGNAVLPILFHEDPRYFRKATGSVKGRFLYALISTVRARSDKGRWVPNYGNVLGNLAAGGVSNLYYPASDRGVDLTFERALSVSAEGAIGALAYEFWPDIVRHFHKPKPQP